MKERLKTTSFWLGLSGAIVIIVECISEVFGIQIGSDVIENIVLTICSVLVLLGIVTKKHVSDSCEADTKELLLELRNDEKDEENKGE